LPHLFQSLLGGVVLSGNAPDSQPTVAGLAPQSRSRHAAIGKFERRRHSEAHQRVIADAIGVEIGRLCH
jgi:hypothetical protein